MIKLRRDDNMSIFLCFDRIGLMELIDAIRSAGTGAASASVAMEFDKSVVTLKRSSPTETFNLAFERGEETQIRSEPDRIVWILEADDLECALNRLEQCLSTGTFSPAEFIRVQVPKNKKLDYVYCEMMEANEANTI